MVSNILYIHEMLNMLGNSPDMHLYLYIWRDSEYAAYSLKINGSLNRYVICHFLHMSLGGEIFISVYNPLSWGGLGAGQDSHLT